jgi:hypothetical protein
MIANYRQTEKGKQQKGEQKQRKQKLQSRQNAIRKYL